MLDFVMNPRCDYKYDYEQIFKDVANGNLDPTSICRRLILDDLFFIIYFVMHYDKANEPFIVQACQDVENGPPTNTLDLWAREHYKSTVMCAETVQYHLKHPNDCTAFFAYVRPLAKTFLRGVKQVFENSEMLKKCFPDVVWQKPDIEAPKWSEDDGIVLKRDSISRRESTVEAWGLIEGMPVGRHFERRVYDDIETDDLVENIEQMRKTIHKFEMSKFLGTQDGVHRVVGTHYHHAGPMAYLRDKKGTDGNPLYFVRKKPGTVDGTATGAPVLVTPKRLEELKSDMRTFNTQILLDPTPVGSIKLHFEYFKPINPENLPTNLIKFLLVDQAGDDDTASKSSGDSWAFGVVGVEPEMDNVGASNVYLLDLESGPMGNSEAIDGIVRMYLRNGFIQVIGIEKVGLSTTHEHVKNALLAHGRMISEENENLVLLRPGNRHKTKRIESALQWPLNNGKLFYSTKIRPDLIEEVKVEMDKFPYFHVDILDMLSYLYDIMPNFPFCRFQATNEVDLTDVFLR